MSPINAQYIAERAAAMAERDQVIAERDEAIAERDFILKFLTDLGGAFSESRRITFKPRANGVEVRVLYPSLAAAMASKVFVGHLRAMLSFAPRVGETKLERVFQAMTGAELRT